MSLRGAGLPHLDLKARTDRQAVVAGVQSLYSTYFSLEDQKTDRETRCNREIPTPKDKNARMRRRGEWEK
jgi:hypothetical protein